MVIGREKEIEILKKALQSPVAELVAMYGRRRVGKTFLIRNVYEKEMIFEVSGLKDASLPLQLENFAVTISTAFHLKIEIATPKSWLQAFRVLITLLEERQTTEKQVVFFDEFPWFDTPKSNFLAAFDHFWNAWASKQNNLVIVICGSAASWMIQNVVRNKGGLHNRLTRKIRLLPFNLYETSEFLKAQNIHFSYYQLAELYMVTGGIPHYLKEMQVGESVIQFIDRQCFTKDGFLRTEFNDLYIALFENAEKHLQIVTALAQKTSGMSRNELTKACKISSGGTLTKILEELAESGFILGYVPFQKMAKDTIFKLSDEYTLFYLKFIQNSKAEGVGTWLMKSQSASYKSWSGFAFENICLKHIPQIKKALGINGIYCEQSIWRLQAQNEEKGAQIDLVLDRNDQCINLFEMKFYNTEFTIDKKYAEAIAHKKNAFLTHTKTNKTIFFTFLTTFGVTQNEHYFQNVQSQLSINVLFAMP